MASLTPVKNILNKKKQNQLVSVLMEEELPSKYVHLLVMQLYTDFGSR